MRLWSSAPALLLLTGLLLGLTLPLGRAAAAQGVSPFAWAFALSGGAALLLAPALLAQTGARFPDLHRWRYFAVAAAVSYALPNLLLFTVMPHVGTGYAGIMYTLSPIFTLLFAGMLGFRRPGWMGIAGIAAGFLGAVLVALSRGGLGQPAALGWIALAMAVPVLLAAGNVYRTLDWPKGAGAVELAVGCHGVSAVLLAACSLPAAGGLGLADLSRVPWLTVAQVASAAAMFPVYFRLQQVGGPVYLSQIGYVAAAVGLAFGTLAFAEHYPLSAWAGAGLIVLGVVLTTLGQVRAVAKQG